MANLHSVLGEPEQRHFMQLTGIHPRGVGMRTHRHAIHCLQYVDLHRRNRRTPQVPGPSGLLAMAMPSGYWWRPVTRA